MAKAFDELRATVGGILQDRFDAKQAEDFVQNEYANFQNATQAFYENLGAVEEGDQLAQRFQTWNQSTFMPFITNASAKYAKNPRIMNMVQKVDEMNRNGLAQFLQVEQAGHDLSQRTGKEKAAEEDRLLDRDKAQAGIGLAKAQAAEAQAQAGYYNRMPTGGSEKGKTELDYFIVPPTASPAEQRIFAMDARFSKEKEDIDQRTLEAAALRYIEQNRGKPRPDGYEWGGKLPVDGSATPDIQLAAEKIKTSANYRKLIEAGRISHQLGPQSLHSHQGYYDDILPFFEGAGSALLPEESIAKLKGNQPADNILSMVLTVPKSSLRSSGFNVASMDDFINTNLKEMESPEQLGPMVSSVFDTAVKPKPDGSAINARTGDPVTNYNDLAKALEFEFERRVTDNLVEGEGSARNDLRRLGRAVVQKFARNKAIELGFAVPKNETLFGKIVENQIGILKSLKGKGLDIADSLIKRLESSDTSDEEILTEDLTLLKKLNKKKNITDKDIKLLQSRINKDEEAL